VSLLIPCPATVVSVEVDTVGKSKVQSDFQDVMIKTETSLDVDSEQAHWSRERQ